MANPQSIQNDFLNKITGVIEDNISNEKFGVSELAREIGMSRSNLLRNVQKKANLSVSQLIRQVRLEKAMEILKQHSLTVSEVSYEVGFSSTSYFIKCFRDYYGYPPGEAGKRDLSNNDSGKYHKVEKKRIRPVLVSTVVIVAVAILIFIIFKPFSYKQNELEKSIAVLPFINDSNDSTNIHIINGLMESILNNLQKIEDLRVISRTSVEKYRNNPKTIPEIARELNVSYFVEGSGQKIDDQILLNIQLIEAQSDRHLWSGQYNREASDIFNLQMEVAKNIADKIQVLISPEVEERINNPPTDDLVAYDYFLRGIDFLNQGGYDNLEDAIVNFEKAVDHDNEFARAYAVIALTYYFLDLYQAEKRYAVQIGSFADKALSLDSQLPQSLVAKGLFYMNNGEYELAVPYFEKALEYNPNYDLAFRFLADIYVNYIPDTEKYLEYSLRGIDIDITAYDSINASFIYLHVSNAFMQSGFTDEAETYINKSLDYNPDNLYAEYVKAYIMFARERNLQQTKELLLQALNKDSTMIDILIETGKICYFMRDYASAYEYFKRFIDIKEALNLEVYRGENAKIGLVLSQMGYNAESEKYFTDYLEYAENDRTVYKHLSLAAYYSYQGDTNKAIEELRLFSQQDHYHYWIILFLELDPLVDNIKDLPEFKSIFNVIENKFWNYHKQIRASLEEKELV